MFGMKVGSPTETIGFFLTPQFSMIALSSAIEPLRVANRIARKDLFAWQLFSLTGEPVIASNSVEFHTSAILDECTSCDTLFVCAGVRAYDHLNPRTSQILRALNRRGMPLGSLCTGTVALAEAGLLDGYKCTIHWENIESLAERYPSLEITSKRFEVDRKRFTSSGGLAAMEMMIASIKHDHGHELSMKVADQFLYSGIGIESEKQKMESAKRTGITHIKLAKAIDIMEARLENPMSISAIAKKIGVSGRHLERLFQDNAGVTPTQYYRDLRLDMARTFLRQTSMPIVEVSIATGFNSPSYFTKLYREKFGHTPNQERQ